MQQVVNSFWKAVGASVAGTRHVARGTGCEDAVAHTVVPTGSGDGTLVCCASDGAGSSAYAAFASQFCTRRVVEQLADDMQAGREVSRQRIFELLEELYDGLEEQAMQHEAGIEEFACTLLCCCLQPGRALFFQVGDGAIVRTDGSGFYVPVWMPDTGEYQNMTSFVVDDRTFANLRILILDETIEEVALFTDGLQMLALNMELQAAHQPFFTPLFKYLRMADDAVKIGVLQRKLEEYLDSDQLNSRTDDDKTLFLATRL